MFTFLQGIHTLGLSLGPGLKENSFRPQDTWNSEAEFCPSTLEMHFPSQAALKGVYWRHPQGPQVSTYPATSWIAAALPEQNGQCSVWQLQVFILTQSASRQWATAIWKRYHILFFKNRLRLPDSRAAQRIPALKHHTHTCIHVRAHTHARMHAHACTHKDDN